MMDTKTDEAVRKLLDLKKLRLPKRPRVVDLHYKTGPDWSGDPSVHVWLILDDATPEEDRTFERLEPARERVREVVRASDLGLIPYVMIRTRSEQTALDAGTYYAT